MNVPGKKLKQMLLTCLALFVLTGCGGTFSGKSHEDISQIQDAITQVAPYCKLEIFQVPNGTLTKENSDYYATSIFTNRLFESDLILAKLENGQIDGSKPPVGESFINQTQDKLYVCNSNGTILSQVSTYQDIWGKYLPDGFFCWSPNENNAKDNLRRLKVCEKRLDEISKLGFWIAIREGISSEDIKEIILPLAEQNRTYGYTDYPVAFYKNYAITLIANFDEVNLATIQSIDSSWKKLVKLLELDLISNYESGYPRTFQQDSEKDFFTSSNYGRVAINLGYKRSLNDLSCSTTLRLSELNYSVGDCGKMEFEVFQSDLNTGDCTFLGYWKDVDGNEKIGVVNYCNKYDSGSFIEGKIYTFKVKVDGSTSYTTKLGYKNNVLSFSAV